jgi:hypothetical protein
LVGKAAIREIEADDLVKQTGGLWMKARNYEFLHQQFSLKSSREEVRQDKPAQTSQEVKRSISTAAGVIFSIGIVLFHLAHIHDLFGWPLGFLAGCFIWGVIFGVPAYFCFRMKSRTGVTVVAVLFLLAAGLDVAVVVSARNALQPQTEQVLHGSESRNQINQSVNTSQQPAKQVRPAQPLDLYPEKLPSGDLNAEYARIMAPVWMTMKSDELGYIRGTVSNDTPETIDKLKLSIKTARWERVYEVRVRAKCKATASFSVDIGEPGLEVENFRVQRE